MPWQIVARERGPDDTEFVLYRFGDQYMIRAGGCELISTRAHGSEEALAQLACETLGPVPAPRVLIGGLGLGYTVRAALDVLPADAQVTVVELVAEIIEWNEGPAGACAGWPLKDPRVTARAGDVGQILAQSEAAYDAVLLDVDNGPEALSWSGNRDLYGAAGTAAARSALRADGVLAVWSSEIDEPYERHLRDAGFVVRRLRVPARGAWDVIRHVVYLAQPSQATKAGNQSHD
jgi:spermidine synthase